MRTLIVAFVTALLVQTQPTAARQPLPGPLVSTEWLSSNLGEDDLLIVDIRSAAAFTEAHIPGSMRTDYPGRWRAERDSVPWVLPAIAHIEMYLSSIGVGAETGVVVVPAGTDSTELGGATWIYWVLKYLGHDAVAILDGGWQAWLSDGRDTEAGAGDPRTPRSFVARPRAQYLATTEHVLARLHTEAVIVDARPPPQYAGETRSNLVVRSGHIPSAISLDNALLYDATADRLLPADELSAQLPPELSERSVEVIVYCNTGHWSSINWFVLHELLGLSDVRLYEGSMAAWSRDPDLPVVVGDDRG